MALNTRRIEIPAYLKVSKVIAYVLYAWIGVAVVSLLLRVFLLLFSANPDAPFVDFIYRVSADYLQPFRGIFPPKTIGDSGYLDVAALFAIIVYLFVMWGFAALISHIQYRIDTSRYDQQKELDRRSKVNKKQL